MIRRLIAGAPRALAALPVLPALASFMVSAAFAGPPPPPGGHIPISFGGANQGGYPPTTTAVSQPAESAALALGMVWSAPNPFRGSTAIHFTLPAGVEARLRVFDLTGRQVRELMHRAQAAGVQEVRWDGSDQKGRAVGAGVFFYQVKAGEHSVTKKLVLLP